MKEVVFVSEKLMKSKNISFCNYTNCFTNLINFVIVIRNEQLQINHFTRLYLTLCKSLQLRA